MFTLGGQLSAADPNAVAFFKKWTEQSTYFQLNFGQRARVGIAAAGDEEARAYVRGKLINHDLGQSWEFSDLTMALGLLASQRDEWSIQLLVEMQPGIERVYSALFADTLKQANGGGDPRIAKAMKDHAERMTEMLNERQEAEKEPAEPKKKSTELKRVDPAIGKDAPEIKSGRWLHTPEPLTLAALKTRIVVVEFWATWCPPCVESIPHLIKLHEKYKDQNVVVIGLTDESLETVEKFAAKKKMNYPVGVGSPSFEDYGVTAIPHAFIVAPGGKIIWSGHQVEELEEALEKAVKENTQPK